VVWFVAAVWLLDDDDDTRATFAGGEAVRASREARSGAHAGTRVGLGTAGSMVPDEGAEDVATLLVRAQRALAARDRAALLRLVAPPTRRSWLEGLLVELAAETTETPSRDYAHRRVRADVRAMLIDHGAYVAERPRELRADSLGEAMLLRVRDPIALHAALLHLAEAHRVPLDPVRAVVGGDKPTASAAPLARLVARIESPAVLAEEPTPSDDVAFVDGPSGRVVVRLWREGPRVWLDES
jgi:hypothetical protein